MNTVEKANEAAKGNYVYKILRDLLKKYGAPVWKRAVQGDEWVPNMLGTLDVLQYSMREMHAHDTKLTQKYNVACQKLRKLAATTPDSVYCGCGGHPKLVKSGEGYLYRCSNNDCPLKRPVDTKEKALENWKKVQGGEQWETRFRSTTAQNTHLRSELVKQRKEISRLSAEYFGPTKVPNAEKLFRTIEIANAYLEQYAKGWNKHFFEHCTKKDCLFELWCATRMVLSTRCTHDVKMTQKYNITHQLLRKLKKREAKLTESLQEAIDLTESALEGEYKPDSFTAQPWKEAIHGTHAENLVPLLNQIRRK